MKHEIKNFFQSQINEHELVIEKTKSSVERNFLNLVNICVKSLKNGKKIMTEQLTLKPKINRQTHGLDEKVKELNHIVVLGAKEHN